jgi:hypothetical protein
MAINISKLKFYSTDLLSSTGINDWVLVNSTQSSGVLTINSNGSASKVITNTNLITASKYMKLLIDININNGVIDTDKLYTSKIVCKLTEKYSINDSDVVKKDLINLYFDAEQAKSLGNGYYRLTKIIQMNSIDLNSLNISIQNNSTSDSLSLKDIKLYRSKDIDEAQYNDASIESSSIYGTYIEARTSDPTGASVGRIWLRVDL